MKKSRRVLAVLAALALVSTGLFVRADAQAATKVLTIAIDLPLQGPTAERSASTNKAIALYLKQINYRAGKYTVKVKSYDNASADTGSWDAAKCAANAKTHIANKSEVAVMGSVNSGCSKVMVPILNQAPGGAITLVSHRSSNPGLTKAWDPGEPGVFYPTGIRNFARVCTTDDVQGAAAAQFAKRIGVKSVYVLNDSQNYGQGVAQSFIVEAKKQGLIILSSGVNYLRGQSWDPGAADYAALFTKIKALKPDMVYVGGSFTNNGYQLIKDKFTILGDNTKVKFMAPDGFSGFREFNELAQAQGAYVSFGGLSKELLTKNDPNGVTAKFMAAYKKEYKKEMVGSSPVYGVAAVQVILAAIAKSDGTRKGVTNAIFSGSGIAIPAKTSVLGKVLAIDPLSGDIQAGEITIKVIKGGVEISTTSWSVSGQL